MEVETGSNVTGTANAKGSTRGNGPSVRLSALSSSASVELTTPVVGSDSVRIASARNEVESFQVVITARGGKLKGVDATLSPLRNRAGDVLAPECVQLFAGIPVPVRMPDPRSVMSPGLWFDALVPRTNPYTGEPVRGCQWGEAGYTGERFRGRDFDVWPNQQQPVWVDVRIPKDAAPGVYEGLLTVRAENAPGAQIPVAVEVWDFALPDGPTHENHFGGFERIAEYHGLERDSEAFYRLEDRYIEMMAAHRINPPLPRRLLPLAGPDGSVVFGAEIDRGITAFVDRHHVTNIEVPHAPFADVLGADRGRAAAYYRSWFGYLARKEWADRAYLYMYDEPMTAEAYERVRTLGAFVKDAVPELRRLVVRQPNTDNPEWGTLEGAVDIWCPLFCYIHEGSMRQAQRAGNHVWTYTALVQSVPSFHPDYETVGHDNPPFWEMDFPLLSYRIAPWLNRRYGATGLLYWSSCFWGNRQRGPVQPPRNPLDNPAYGDHWNGEGMLFYPGMEAGIEGPIASIRLKNLRDGMEDYEYFVLLEKLGGGSVVEEMVRSAVPTWGSWDEDGGRLLDRRSTIAKEILRRQ